LAQEGRQSGGLAGQRVEGNPSWYRDAVIYELHVKAFKDSAGDGVGDFRGLTSKLDYLQDLGVTAVWLLPFYPSPLKDDGYDISDYFGVHRLYGELGDFREFLHEAHSRGIKVIIELVVNHTSSSHDWFTRARRSPPASKLRDFYVWSDDQRKYSAARVIFKDAEASNWTWDPAAKAYYWHRFYSHQPDLNFDNPEVEKAIFEVMDFWLKMGVDGLRLDAVPYLFEREGTNCENLPETHALLKKFRAHMDSKFKDRMLLAEANQWPSDAAKYFGQGDECNMAFHFPLMPRMFMSIQMEDRFPVVDILEETPQIPDGCQWAIFLRNHDELTLEMVTDEERDYMYRVYAHDKEARLNLGIRRRLAPLLGNDRRKIELMNALLFTLPGTPVIYYGDEIGMGDNIYLGDRNGVRTPMQWSADLNAGFSRANPQKLYLPVVIDPKYHYAAVNVENQQGDPSSLLWWFKKLIFLRKRLKPLGRGSIRFLLPESEKVLAFVREFEGEAVLVVANLSRKPQPVELDLSAFKGCGLQEVIGGSPFPEVGGAPYRLTLGAYGFFVFTLTQKARVRKEEPISAVELVVGRSARELFDARHRAVLEGSVLPSFLASSRWFGGKARYTEGLDIVDVVETPDAAQKATYNLLLEVTYTEGLPERYFLPVSYLSDEALAGLAGRERLRMIARVRFPQETGAVYDAAADPSYGKALLQSLMNKRVFPSAKGKIVFSCLPGFRRSYVSQGQLGGEVRVLAGEQSNSSLVFEDRVVVKLMRRVEEGIQPEVEIGEFLTRRSFGSTPPFLGHVEYQAEDSDPTTLAVVEGYVRNQGDAWKLFTTEFEAFAEKVSGRRPDGLTQPGLRVSLVRLAKEGNFDKVFEVTGPLFKENVGALGKRTAEFHRALSSDTEDPSFAPEPFGYLGQISLGQEMLGEARRTLQFASKAKVADPANAKALSNLMGHKDDVLHAFERLKTLKLDSVRCRIHGDYHLGQVLYTGKDFVIVDYEGEPARALSERRLKRSPLRDVAGMVRSFHYAAMSTLARGQESRGYAQSPGMDDWAREWYLAVASTFLGAYLEAVHGSGLAPSDEGTLEALLDAYLLEKALYELTYELNNRPGWIGIPIEGIIETLGIKTTPAESKK
jgi:maltose alpha-D-glucosyltransferase / alpha-amylase